MKYIYNIFLYNIIYTIHNYLKAGFVFLVKTKNPANNKCIG